MKKFGHKRTVKEKKEGVGSQLVDVFISMDSGGVFIFAFAGGEHEQEQQEQTKKAAQSTTHSNQPRLVRCQTIVIIRGISIIETISNVILITVVVIIRVIVISTIIVIGTTIDEMKTITVGINCST